MNRNISILMTSSLLFVACNNTPTPQKLSQKIEAPQKVQTEIVAPQEEPQTTPSASTTSVNNSEPVKYTKDKAIIQTGLLHIKGFTGTLKPTLKSMLEQDPSHVTAMGACSTMATQMKNEYNAKSGNVQIRRTALKYRNPANHPDTTDQEVMYRLQAVNNKEPLAVDMGGNHYRVYQPLQVQKACLICHGSNISPKIAQMIQQKYPTDMATGFKLGEFRGAVVAEIQK